MPEALMSFYVVEALCPVNHCHLAPQDHLIISLARFSNLPQDIDVQLSKSFAPLNEYIHAG